MKLSTDKRELVIDYLYSQLDTRISSTGEFEKIAMDLSNLLGLDLTGHYPTPSLDSLNLVGLKRPIKGYKIFAIQTWQYFLLSMIAGDLSKKKDIKPVEELFLYLHDIIDLSENPNFTNRGHKVSCISGLVSSMGLYIPTWIKDVENRKISITDSFVKPLIDFSGVMTSSGAVILPTNCVKSCETIIAENIGDLYQLFSRCKGLTGLWKYVQLKFIYLGDNEDFIWIDDDGFIHDNLSCIDISFKELG